MKNFTLQELESTFNELSHSSEEGILGVLKFEGETPGPVVGITACTHGDEPSGLAVARYFIELFKSEPLKQEAVYLVVNNIEATRRYFAAPDELAQSKARYADINMNRLPENMSELGDDTRYEIKRAQELIPVWKRFDVGLDIHSTSTPTEPMIISRGDNFEAIRDVIRGFPIERLTSNIDAVQKNHPAFSWYGHSLTAPIFAIETGQHTDPASFERSVTCAESVLRNLHMIEGEKKSDVGEFKEYVVRGSIMFDDMAPDLVKEFQSYDVVEIDELIASTPTGNEIRATHNGHLLFPTNKRKDRKDISEEIAFVTEPVKIRRM